MKNINKNENKTSNVILIINSILILLIGISFFFSDLITFMDGCQIFYVAMLMYFGCEFTNYLLTRKQTGMNSLYVSLACIIASVSGLKYMNEISNNVIAFTLIGWIIIMVIIKLINIEDTRKKMDTRVFVNIFTLSLFILLGFLVITNIYKGISNVNLMLGFFFTANGILNIIDTFVNLKKGE